ncbi:hypothetical protein [Endozoicomonas sp. YOMI1]|uniref:hypothetical protein n=1 Tax=Endozoicomonas sp. YOMI1 TaxID=2828739 RepID=UPI0021478A3D|nr:hypothetical protein [Endozoicomonas sp. YOMI1]
MSRKAFEELLKSHNGPDDQGHECIDWGKQRDEWLGFIAQFYETLEQWFKPYKDDHSLDYQYKELELTEDNIGSYQTKQMLVQFAQQNLKITPVGTLLIGTKGRIDMEGGRGRIQFILADKNSHGPGLMASYSGPSSEETKKTEKEWGWKIVLKVSNRISFAEFNEDNFFDALMEVVNA